MTTWPEVELGDLARWGSGGTPSRSRREFFGGSIPWAAIGDLTDGEVWTTEESITPEALNSSSAKMVPPGSLLIAMYGSIGKLGIPKIDLATNQAIAFATPGERLDLRYFYHCMHRDRARLLASGNGGTQSNISQTKLKEWKIPLPPLPEQRRIAAILDHADALRSKRRESLNSLAELKQAIFMQMFGASHASWDRFRIADVASKTKGAIRTGPFGSQLLHEEFVEDGVAVLGIDNAVSNKFEWGKRRFITHQKYKELSRYTVYPGDVLITIMGTNGRCAVVPDDIPLAINTKHLCCITPDQQVVKSDFLHSYFLYHPIARDYLRKTAKGAIMAGLNMGIVKDLPLIVPPLPLQEAFVERIRLTERQATRANQSRDSLASQFAALHSRAFCCEL